MSLISLVTRHWYVYYYIPRSPIDWESFHPGYVERLRLQGRGIIIHFTADWDMTSARMTRTLPFQVIESPEARSVIYRRNFTPILVNMTTREDECVRLLESLGGKQVPTTIVVPPGEDMSPIVLLRLRWIMEQEWVIR